MCVDRTTAALEFQHRDSRIAGDRNRGELGAGVGVERSAVALEAAHEVVGRHLHEVATLRGDDVAVGVPASAHGLGVGWDFFTTLGVSPALGRLIPLDLRPMGIGAVTIVGVTRRRRRQT